MCIYRTSLSLGRFWYIHLLDKTFNIYSYIKPFDYKKIAVFSHLLEVFGMFQSGGKKSNVDALNFRYFFIVMVRK